MKNSILAAAASAALLATGASGVAEARSAVQFGVSPGGFYLNVQPQPRYYGYGGYAPYIAPAPQYYAPPPAYYQSYDEPYYYEDYYRYRHKRKKIYDDNH